jgi:hypothetical protein
VLVSTIFAYLKTGSLGFVGGAIAIGTVVIGLAMLATLSSEESYHKDLDYVETH